jgi:predicted 2-oxoglutarate/Fe(II)-dependent dioxygenase YbiX
VYRKGQFFLPHQDSEKDDAMIATLVVTLPSAHTGGELVVHHLGAATTYRGFDTRISLVAFYADCRHEVRPVTSGHRIALTYDLLLHATRPTTCPARDTPRSFEPGRSCSSGS